MRSNVSARRLGKCRVWPARREGFCAGVPGVFRTVSRVSAGSRTDSVPGDQREGKRPEGRVDRIAGERKTAGGSDAARALQGPNTGPIRGRTSSRDGVRRPLPRPQPAAALVAGDHRLDPAGSGPARRSFASAGLRRGAGPSKTRQFAPGWHPRCSHAAGPTPGRAAAGPSRPEASPPAPASGARHGTATACSGPESGPPPPTDALTPWAGGLMGGLDTTSAPTAGTRSE